MSTVNGPRQPPHFILHIPFVSLSLSVFFFARASRVASAFAVARSTNRSSIASPSFLGADMFVSGSGLNMWKPDPTALLLGDFRPVLSATNVSGTLSRTGELP